MLKSIVPKPQNKELFCQQYWRKRMQTVNSKNNYNMPSLFDYHDYNLLVLGVNSSKTQNLLGILDLSFKLFKPSKEKYIFWRGITNPFYMYSKSSKLTDYFNKSKNIQPGEILYMKEFPYVSSSCDYAKSHISNLSKNYINILFEIEIPKGTVFLNNGDRNILQRCSKFLCTDTKRVKDNNKIYQHIKLKLLSRDVQYNNKYKENFIERIFNKLHCIVNK